MSQGLVMKDGCLAELQDLEWLKVEACSLQQAPNISDVAFSLQGLRQVSLIIHGVVSAQIWTVDISRNIAHRAKNKAPKWFRFLCRLRFRYMLFIIFLMCKKWRKTSKTWGILDHFLKCSFTPNSVNNDIAFSLSYNAIQWLPDDYFTGFYQLHTLKLIGK